MFPSRPIRLLLLACAVVAVLAANEAKGAPSLAMVAAANADVDAHFVEGHPGVVVVDDPATWYRLWENGSLRGQRPQVNFDESKVIVLSAVGADCQLAVTGATAAHRQVAVHAVADPDATCAEGRGALSAVVVPAATSILYWNDQVIPVAGPAVGH